MHRIAIVVDNPTRDLPGLVLLAMDLCQKGAICYLVPLNSIKTELWAISPDFVLLNYLRDNNTETVRKANESGILVGVLDTEGGVFSDLESYYGSTLAKNSYIRGMISRFFTWGPKLAEHSIEKKWFDKLQVTTTGSPKMDLYVSPWKEAMLESYSESISQFGSDFILFNGNFPIANPGFSTRAKELESLMSTFNFEESVARKFQETQQEGLVQLTKLALAVANRFPKINVIYRPHPFERTETYEDILGNKPNLHTIKDGTAHTWINSSIAVIQRSCSTAIESAIAGIPTLSPVWVPTPREMPSAEAVSIPCNTTEDILHNLELITNHQLKIPDSISNNLNEVIKEWFFSNDGLSYSRISSSIVDAISSSDKTTSKGQCLNFLYGLDNKELSTKSRIGKITRRFLNLDTDYSFKDRRVIHKSKGWEGSGKYFGATEVEKLSNCFYNHSKLHNKVRLKRVQVKLTRESKNYIRPFSGPSVMISTTEL